MSYLIEPICTSAHTFLVVEPPKILLSQPDKGAKAYSCWEWTAHSQDLPINIGCRHMKSFAIIYHMKPLRRVPPKTGQRTLPLEGTRSNRPAGKHAERSAGPPQRGSLMSGWISGYQSLGIWNSLEMRTSYNICIRKRQMSNSAARKNE